MHKILHSYGFWAIVVLVALASFIGIRTQRKLERNQQSIDATPSIVLQAKEVMQDPDKWIPILQNHIGQTIEMEAVVCEYFVLTRSKRYEESDVRVGDLELTAAWQTDTGVVVARELRMDTLQTDATQWNACDSAVAVFKELYGIHALDQRLFLDVSIDQFVNGTSSSNIIHGGNCMTYLGYRKAYQRNLENFCYNTARFKAVLREFKREDNTIYLFFDHGVVLDIKPSQFKYM
jgi:hypothetical protein